MANVEDPILSRGKHALGLLFPLSSAVRPGAAPGAVHHQKRPGQRQVQPHAPGGPPRPGRGAGDGGGALLRRPGFSGRAHPAPAWGGHCGRHRAPWRCNISTLFGMWAVPRRGRGTRISEFPVDLYFLPAVFRVAFPDLDLLHQHYRQLPGNRFQLQQFLRSGHQV